jgi:hypothetical protein
VLLSQADVQSADLFFEPPMTKRAANRKVFLIAARGAILEGIKVTKKRGITVPTALKIQSRPDEQDEGAHLGEQLLTDLTRDILRTRTQDTLRQGVSLWPEYRERQR